MKVKIQIVRGVAGICLVVNGTRIAGPKPWGGGTVNEWDVDLSSLTAALPKSELKGAPPAPPAAPPATCDHEIAFDGVDGPAVCVRCKEPVVIVSARSLRSAPPAGAGTAESPDWSELAGWILDRLLCPVLACGPNIKFVNEQLQAMWKCGHDCATPEPPKAGGALCQDYNPISCYSSCDLPKGHEGLHRGGGCRWGEPELNPARLDIEADLETLRAIATELDNDGHGDLARDAMRLRAYIYAAHPGERGGNNLAQKAGSADLAGRALMKLAEEEGWIVEGYGAWEEQTQPCRDWWISKAAAFATPPAGPAVDLDMQGPVPFHELGQMRAILEDWDSYSKSEREAPGSTASVRAYEKMQVRYAKLIARLRSTGGSAHG